MKTFRTELKELYLDWYNNYLTVGKFAEPNVPVTFALDKSTALFGSVTVPLDKSNVCPDGKVTVVPAAPSI